MSRFSRSSPWLRTIFPSSEAPIEDIGDLSESVFLTQPFIDPFGIRNPRGWFSESATLTLAAGPSVRDLGSVNVDEIVRLLGISYVFPLGPTADTRIYLIASQDAIGVFDITTSPYGPISDEKATGTRDRGVIPVISPIIGGGQNIFAVFLGATLNDQVRIKFFFIAAPVGTVFYV